MKMPIFDQLQHKHTYMTPAIKKYILVVFLFIFNSPEVSAQDDPTINVTEVSTKKKYGRDIETPIMVGTVANEYEYLSQLCGPNGEKINYERIDSCCEFVCPSCPMGAGLLDEWEIRYSGLKKPIIIYINGYLYDNPMAPKKLGLKSQN